jgi:hypothetical protein
MMYINRYDVHWRVEKGFPMSAEMVSDAEATRAIDSLGISQRGLPPPTACDECLNRAAETVLNYPEAA